MEEGHEARRSPESRVFLNLATQSFTLTEKRAFLLGLYGAPLDKELLSPPERLPGTGLRGSRFRTPARGWRSSSDGPPQRGRTGETSAFRILNVARFLAHAALRWPGRTEQREGPRFCTYSGIDCMIMKLRTLSDMG